MQMKKPSKATPELRLTGHKDLAPFALSTSSLSPTVASGGEDTNVLIWNLEDAAGSSDLARLQGDSLAPRVTLAGHAAMISDVVFQPGTDHMLASSADDHIIKLWDTREGQSVHDVRPFPFLPVPPTSVSL